jgi:hypothetical protein
LKKKIFNQNINKIYKKEYIIFYKMLKLLQESF